MNLPPKEWARLKAFRDLIQQTISAIEGAGGQGALASAAGDAAAKGDATDGELVVMADGSWRRGDASGRLGPQALTELRERVATTTIAMARIDRRVSFCDAVATRLMQLDLGDGRSVSWSGSS